MNVLILDGRRGLAIAVLVVLAGCATAPPTTTTGGRVASLPLRVRPGSGLSALASVSMPSSFARATIASAGVRKFRVTLTVTCRS